MAVAYRHVEGSIRQIGAAFGALFTALASKGVPLAQAPAVGVYNAGEDFDPNDAVFDVCAVLAGPAEAQEGFQVQTLPAIRAAATVHRGPYEQIGPVYETLFDWIGQQGLQAAGPVREVYVVGPDPVGRTKPADFVTEIQVPVSETAP